jgi:hypothetical protein
MNRFKDRAFGSQNAEENGILMRKVALFAPKMTEIGIVSLLIRQWEVITTC